MPRLVGDDDLPSANAARVSIMHVCVVAGPVIGAVLLLLGSAATAFAVNGVTFLIGAAVVAALPREALRRSPATRRRRASRRTCARAGTLCASGEHAAGWSAPTSWPAPSTARSPCCSSCSADRLGLGPGGYGYLLSASALGGVLAAGAADRAAACRAAARSRSPRRSSSSASRCRSWAWPDGSRACSRWPRSSAPDRSSPRSWPTRRCSARSIPSVFGRAYGIVLSASLAGIVAGALLAPLAVSLLGLDGTLIALAGALVLVYGALALVRPTLAPPGLSRPSRPSGERGSASASAEDLGALAR